MFKVIMEFKATKDYDSFNKGLFGETGETAEVLGYETQEDIDNAICEGWLEFDGGVCRVFADEG